MARRVALLLGLVLVALVWLLRGGGEGRRDARVVVAEEPGAARERGELDLAARWFDLRRADRAAISGRVLDRQGRGVAGASVCAGGVSPELSQIEAAERRCVESEADGAYRIEDLLPVPHQVSASAPRMVPNFFRVGEGARARGRVVLVAGRERRGVDIVLAPGGVEVTGVVRDISGGEIAAALVRSSYAHAATNAEGRFSLWVRPGVTSVEAHAEGYVDGGARGIAPGHAFEVYLTPESVIVGRVVRAEDGAPIAGAEVFANTKTGYADLGPALTDAGGNFRLVGLMPGTYKPAAYHDAAFGYAEESVDLGLGETSSSLTIRAHPAYLVEGAVVREGGAACDAGEVQLTSSSGSVRFEPVGPEGGVRFAGVVADTYAVSVYCEGGASLPNYPPVEVVDRPHQGLRWEVRAGRAIRGRLVDAAGEGVEGEGVWATALSDPDDPRGQVSGPRSGLSGVDGSFEIAGLLPGRYSLGVSAEERPGPERPLEVSVREGEDVAGVTIVLAATGVIRGSVRDAKERPIKGASLGLEGATWSSPSTRAADDGSFVLPHVAAGAYRVVASVGMDPLRAPGDDDAAPAGVPVEVRAGETVDVRLVVEARDGKIQGRVLGPSGAPLTDAFVEVARERDGESDALAEARWGSLASGAPSALTDLDGRFTVTGLSEGRYTLYAHRRGGGEAVREHVGVGDTVDLQIAEEAALGGLVRLAGGGAPQSFSVSLRSKAGYSAGEHFYRTDGIFRFSEVPPGDYAVEVQAAEGTGKAKVQVAAGGHGEVQVELAARVTVRGRVVDFETGEPVPGMKVRFNMGQRGDMESGAPGRKITDDAGAFEVLGVASGPGEVQIEPRVWGEGDYAWTQIFLTVPGSGAAIELPPFRIVRERSGGDERAGDLGYKLRPDEPGEPPGPCVVGLVRPGGPAARAGLQVGDEIVSIDGHDLTGAGRYLYDSFAYPEAGTTVRLGLERGPVLEVTAGARGGAR